MADIVMDEEPDPQDGPAPAHRSLPAAVRDGVRGLGRFLVRHRRGTVASLGVVALIVGSAGAARFVTNRADRRAETAQVASLDGAGIASPTDLSVLWTAAPDEAARNIGTADGLWLSISDDRTTLAARDADTGEARWQLDLPDGEGVTGCSAPVPGVPSFACVIAQDDALVLVAVTTDDGTEAGRTTLPDTEPPMVVAADDADVLLVTGQDDGSGTVTRRSPVDGAERWTTAVPAPVAPPQDAGIGQTVEGGLLNLEGRLRATLELDTGALVDVLPAPNDADQVSTGLVPLPGGGVALWRTGSNADPPTGVVFDPGQGVRFALTEAPLSVFPDDDSGPDSILVSTGRSVQALDPRTGESLWTRPAPVSEAMSYDGALTLLLADPEETTIEQLDLTGGTQTWTTQWDGVSDARFYLVDGTLLVAGTSTERRGADPAGADRLAQVDLRDGTLRELPWPAALGSSVFFFVQDDRLYAWTPGDFALARVG